MTRIQMASANGVVVIAILIIAIAAILIVVVVVISHQHRHHQHESRIGLDTKPYPGVGTVEAAARRRLLRLVPSLVLELYRCQS